MPCVKNFSIGTISSACEKMPLILNSLSKNFLFYETEQAARASRGSAMCCQLNENGEVEIMPPNAGGPLCVRIPTGAIDQVAGEKKTTFKMGIQKFVIWRKNPHYNFS